MKTITAGLQTHLDGTTTSLATLWEIVRTDTVKFFFTDHDQDIPFEGDIYKAATGYNRTAIANNSTFSVDNLDVEGIFDSAEISEQDIAAGLFDRAEVFVSIINFNNIADGVLKLRRGRFGEVIATKQGWFRTELRGMTQDLQQVIGELYQPECRADLGDSRCKVPVDPPRRLDNTAFSLGDFIRVNTLSPIQSAPFLNPGFDTGDLTAWTTVTGTPLVVTSNGSHLPQAGSHFLNTGAASNYEVRQDAILQANISTANIDAGNVTASAAVFQSNPVGGATDTGAFTVEALDGSGLFISTLFDSGFARRGTGSNNWVTTGLVMTNVTLPSGTRQIRYRLRGNFVNGNTSFDTLSASVTDGTVSDLTVPQTLPLPEQDVYENRIYECTIAGTSGVGAPVFSTTVDTTTVDGTATFTSRQAWMRHAEIDTITDTKNFTLAVAFDEARAVDDYFNGGAIEFESGSNDNIVFEMRDWVQSTRTVTIFLPTSFVVAAGDKVRLYPGCDKRSTTCVTKFVIPNSQDFNDGNIKNFRGEPFVPGQDEMFRYPDAKSG